MGNTLILGICNSGKTTLAKRLAASIKGDNVAHSLILGMTESGKTTLAKRLASKYKSGGLKCIVYDPMDDPEWEADFRTDNPTEFDNVARKSTQCMIFVDEAGELLGQDGKEYFWLATRSRHFGHSVHFISQRGAQLAKTVRDQCANLFLFNCSLDDAKLLANEWNREELKAANTLQQGEFFSVPRFGEIERLKLW